MGCACKLSSSLVKMMIRIDWAYVKQSHELISLFTSTIQNNKKNLIQNKKTQNIEAFPLGNRFYYYYGIDTNFPWSMKLIHWMSLSFPLNTEPIYRYYLLYKRIKKASGLVVYVWSLCVHALTKGVTQHTHIF